MRLLTESSGKKSGVLVPEGSSAFRRTTSEFCLSLSVSGIPSASFPISSALSCNAFLEEPSMSCRPRTMYAVTANMTTNPITGKFEGL